MARRAGGGSARDPDPAGNKTTDGRVNALFHLLSIEAGVGTGSRHITVASCCHAGKRVRRAVNINTCDIGIEHPD
jgi:hypothetical protein